MEESDQLLRSSQQGNIDAFGKLVLLHEGWLRAFLRARLRDSHAVDDLAQDVFVTAFLRVRDFRLGESFEAWLRGIAINHFRNHVRKRRESHIGGQAELDELMSQRPEISLCGGSLLEALEECLSRLNPASRELLDERYLKGHTVRTLSAESGMNYSALTMRLHRIREQLAQCVQLKLGMNA
ncbi:MAG: sigma-70 family RNA polymerase sigma factor [Akkermansiaceae bacterium]|nr:sigma-70 family RNA polymerase sigma factor [Akkermansiaceae bacterium]